MKKRGSSGCRYSYSTQPVAIRWNVERLQSKPSLVTAAKHRYIHRRYHYVKGGRSGFRGWFSERGDSTFPPKPDHEMVGNKIKQIASEDERYLIYTEDGELYTLQFGDFEARPNRISLLKGKTITQLICSEYFQAMFRSNMKESKNNQIDIQDCSKVVFLWLLEYI